MTNTGYLNLRGKDGSQSSITCEKADCQPAHKFISRSNFHFFLRGLISNLSLATKFYSFPRRPNFLGLWVSKSRQAHYPRLSESLKSPSALSKFLNSLVPFSFGYIDPCRHLFSFFGNRTDFSAALLFIPDRRLYE